MTDSKKLVDKKTILKYNCNNLLRYYRDKLIVFFHIPSSKYSYRNITINMKKETSIKQQTFYSRQVKLRLTATTAELKFKDKLDKCGIRYIFQKGFIAGNGYYIVDFYLPKPYKLCIEIDGGYHDTIGQKYKDGYKNRYLIEERGFRVLRIKNEDVDSFDIEGYIKTADSTHAK